MSNIQRYTCYVSSPLGTKLDPTTGRTINFDKIYFDTIQPTVTDAGLECIRGDELMSQGTLQRSVFEAIMRSDVMIADVNTSNPNVLYELGIRHAIRRMGTIVISSDMAQIPWNIANQRVLMYQIGDSGVIDLRATERFRAKLSEMLLKVILDQSGMDSPIYAYFPDLRVKIPYESLGETSQYRTRSKEELDKGQILSDLLDRLRSTAEITSYDDRIEAFRSLEPDILSADDPSATLPIELLRSYRDTSSWNDMIRLFELLPEGVREMPFVIQQTALALNRTGASDRALAMLNDLVHRKEGGDSETYGLLGRIYKDRFAASNDKQDLELAIDAYRKGFDANPSDYYPGVNLVTLLNAKGDKAAHEEMNNVLPILRQIVDEQIKKGPVGYWETATGLELAALARDWKSAQQFAAEARSRAAAEWMVETTSQNLQVIANSSPMTEFRNEFEAVIDKLSKSSESGGAAR